MEIRKDGYDEWIKLQSYRDRVDRNEEVADDFMSDGPILCRIIYRLIVLRGMCSVEEDQEPVSKGSCDDLLSFIHLINPQRYPGIISTNEGLIQIQWTRESDGATLTVTFYTSSLVKSTMIIPRKNDKSREQVLTFSGDMMDFVYQLNHHWDGDSIYGDTESNSSPEVI